MSYWLESNSQSDGAGRAALRGRLLAVIADETGVSPVRLTDDTTLAEDLGVSGYDGADLLEAIGREFGLDLAVIDWAEYFGEEMSVDPLQSIWTAHARLPDCAAPVRSPALRVGDLLRTVECGRWCEPRN